MSSSGVVEATGSTGLAPCSSFVRSLLLVLLTLSERGTWACSIAGVAISGSKKCSFEGRDDMEEDSDGVAIMTGDVVYRDGVFCEAEVEGGKFGDD